MDKRALDSIGLVFAILSTSLSYDYVHIITYRFNEIKRFEKYYS